MSRQLLLLDVILLALILVACGGDTSPTSSDPIVNKGERVFKRDCASCHTVKQGVDLVGPSLAGIASRAATRIEGLDSRQYIHQSITKPSAHVVDGFVDQMPASFGDSLSVSDLEGVIAYLMTLE